MPLYTETFECDQHANNISKKLQTFYRDQLFFDIALITKTDNMKVHAHRTVLSASSDYFLAMLCSTLKEARADVIELGIDGATLKAVVDFMYSGTIELRWDNVSQILTAADVLKMSTLKVACSDFIGKTIDASNWLSIVSMAKLQQSAELHKKAFEFALQNFDEVFETENFLQITEDQLSELISSDDLCVYSEETVFESVVSWVNYDRGLREQFLIGLLSHVRFTFLTPEFIIDNRQYVSKTYECLELLFSWLESHLSQTKLAKCHFERKKVNKAQRETLGFVSGLWTDNLKMQSLDPDSNIWICEDLPPSLIRREDYSAIVIEEKLIVAGGLHKRSETYTVECLDLQTKEWTKLPPMLEPRTIPAIAGLNGDLYVFGGKYLMDWLYSMEKYDFRTCEWKELASISSHPNSYWRLTVLDELLYAVGDGSSRIECYNPAYNKWTQLPHKNERSRDYGIAGVGGYLYAVGGKFKGRASSIIERFDPSTNTWTVIRPCLGLAYTNWMCISWNNQLIACRGYDNQHEILYSVVEYNPEEKECRTLPSFVDQYFNLTSCCLFTFTK